LKGPELWHLVSVFSASFEKRLSSLLLCFAWFFLVVIPPDGYLVRKHSIFFSAITWYQKPSTMSLAPTYFVVKMLLYTQNGLSHFLTGTKEKIKSMCVLSEKGEWMHAQRLLQVQFVPIELVHTKVLSH